MNEHDWPHVARLYNGPGYAANHYDTRLADAFKRWSRRLETIAPGGAPREVPPEQALPAEEVRDIQQRLRDLGYAEVGAVDGRWGTRTTGAIAAFQAHEGLKVTGHYDPATKAALEAAAARPVARERAEAQPGDLNSRTVTNAEHLSAWGQLMKWLGLGGAGVAGADNSGLLDQVKAGTDRLGTLRDICGTVADLGAWALAHWWLFALVAGFFIAAKAERIIAVRLDDHRTGVHAG